MRRILDRLRRLEHRPDRPRRDDDADGFIAALVGDEGDEINAYREYYGPSGWDAIGLLSALAPDDWKENES